MVGCYMCTEADLNAYVAKYEMGEGKLILKEVIALRQCMPGMWQLYNISVLYIEL